VSACDAQNGHRVSTLHDVYLPYIHINVAHKTVKGRRKCSVVGGVLCIVGVVEVVLSQFCLLGYTTGVLDTIVLFSLMRCADQVH